MKQEGFNGLADILLPTVAKPDEQWAWLLLLIAAAAVLLLAFWLHSFSGRIWRLQQACRFSRKGDRQLLHHAAAELKRQGRQPNQGLDALRFGRAEPPPEQVQKALKSLK